MGDGRRYCMTSWTTRLEQPRFTGYHLDPSGEGRFCFSDSLTGFPSNESDPFCCGIVEAGDSQYET